MNKLALIFPGQGSQYVGMGKELCLDFPIATERFEEASDTLGFDLKKLCFEGNIDELTKTANAQPAILTISNIADELFKKEIGISPLFLAGHSLGEYSALVSSGVLTFTDAIKIVRKRGLLMQESQNSDKGKMVAIVGIGGKDLEDICLQFSTNLEPVVIACSNSINQNVISGHTNSINRVISKLESMSINYSVLRVSNAFHSPMMKVAAYHLTDELNKYNFKHPKLPVISNVTARPYNSKEEITELLGLQMTKTVRWADTMQYLIDMGIKHAIEIGPNKVLRNLIKTSFSAIRCESIGNTKDLANIKSLILPTLEEGINNVKMLEKCITEAIILKNRNKSCEEFDGGVFVPYETLKKMIKKYHKDGMNSSELKKALELVNLILLTKKATEEEHNLILNKSFI